MKIQKNIHLLIKMFIFICGVGTIYDGTFSGKKIPGNGIFEQMLIDNGIKVVDCEKISEK